MWVPRGDRLFARCPCSRHGSSECKDKAWRKDWEMAVLVSPHVSLSVGTVRGMGSCCWVLGWGALQTVTRAKTDFGLTEGKGKCGAAFTPAANLAVGSLFFFFFKTLDEKASV